MEKPHPPDRDSSKIHHLERTLSNEAQEASDGHLVKTAMHLAKSSCSIVTVIGTPA
jgi:hypothetical protein